MTQLIPEDLVKHATKHCRYIPGDFPSIALAQWAIESGWGHSPDLGGVLYREHNNAGCIKVATDRRFQDGDYQGHATYASLDRYFIDRRRILTLYQARSRHEGIPHWDIITLLDLHWAPDQDYGDKLRHIIRQHGLCRYDPIASP